VPNKVVPAWRFANAGLPVRSAGTGPLCSPPGGGWCASAETTLRGDRRASQALPLSGVMSNIGKPPQIGKTPKFQPRRAPVGRFVRLEIRLVISASTFGAGKGHANPCLFPAHSQPVHPANGLLSPHLPEQGAICGWFRCGHSPVLGLLALQMQSGN